jgi:hypothetical protein
LNMFSESDKAHFETQLSEAYAMQQLGAKQCPKCYTYCMPFKQGQRVMGCICKLKFCFLCAHPWKSTNSTNCCCGLCEGGCSLDKQELRILRASPLISTPMDYCKVRGVPKVRACPCCGTLVEHSGACKHMTCIAPGCKTSYCHICVRTKAEHTADNWNLAYPCEVAPIQTVIKRA